MGEGTVFAKGLRLGVLLLTLFGGLAVGLLVAGVVKVPFGGWALANQLTTAPYLATYKSADSQECERALIHLEVHGAGEPGQIRRPLDVMLVLDRSGSMGVPPEDPPIDHAKEAAKLLVDELDPALDQVGFVSYATTATLAHQLTSGFDQVKTAIDDMQAEGRTNIGDAVFEAQAELDAHGRVDAVAVIVLVSDGVANERHIGPACITEPIAPTPCTEDAVNQAATAKGKGTTIFTIGLNLDWIGEHCTTLPAAQCPLVEALARETLQTMASPPPEDHYFEAPDPTDLEGIFVQIATIITNIAGDNVRVVDVLPSYLHYIPGSAVPPPSSVVGQTLTWDLGSMSIGDVHTIDFAVSVDAPGPDLLMDEYPDSRVEYDDYQGNPRSVPFPETRQTVLPCGTDLAIDKSDNPDPVVAGGDLVYTLVVTNNGPSDATNVEVADTLPAGVSYVGDDCGGSASGNSWSWGIGSLLDGTSATCHITVSVNSSTSGTITNTASVSSTTSDTNPANNTDTEDTLVQAEADLAIEKTDNPDPVVPGSNLVYTLVVTNNGPSDATNVVVADDLPTGVSYVSDTDSCVESPVGRLTCPLGDIAAGGSESFDVTVAVDLGTSGVIIGGACVSSDTPDPNPANDCDKEDTTVGAPCGDVDCNGSLQMLDAMMIAQYIMGERCGGDVCDDPGPDQCIYLPAADVDCNGLVQMLDAMLVSQCVMGLIDCDCDWCWPCD